MSLRLGVNRKIVPFSDQEIVDADIQFNRFVINTAQLFGKALIYGAVASIFFLRKRSIIFYSGGFGVGYSFFRTFGTCCGNKV